jgi:hypothetical protein
MEKRDVILGTFEKLKESNPVQVADYAIANNISEHAAFAW